MDSDFFKDVAEIAGKSEGFEGFEGWGEVGAESDNGVFSAGFLVLGEGLTTMVTCGSPTR